MDHFADYPGREQIFARGGTKMAIRLANGCQVDLRVVGAESFGAALQYFTGSQAHNIVLRGLAKDRKMKINEYGVFRGEKRIAGRSEEEVYGALGSALFSPRDSRGAVRVSMGRERPPAGTGRSAMTFAATCTCTAPGPTAWPRSRTWWRPPSDAG